MLVLTPSAVSHLITEAHRMGLDEGIGVRVFAEDRSGGVPAIGIRFAEHPSYGDEVSDQYGKRLFVAPEIAPTLSDAVLDVRASADGVKLVLVQSGDATSN